MADHKKWFKVWNSILSDPDFWHLSLEDIGRWTLLGAFISQHGKNGKLDATLKALSTFFRCPEQHVIEHLNKLANVSIEHVNMPGERVKTDTQNDNGRITVTFKNWRKYQMDSTGYERLKKYRTSKNDNGTREDKTKTKKKTKTIDAVSLNLFNKFYTAYPKHEGKERAIEVWKKISPDENLLNIILAKLILQKESPQWKKNDGQYIPLPSTYLNQKRWEDEIGQIKKDWREV